MVFPLLEVFQGKVDYFAPPHPRSSTKIARSRRPLRLWRSSAWSRDRLCLTVNQFPRRTPIRFAPFTRRMPAASSGLRSPVSAASYANRRTAASRRLMVAGARWRDSSSIRYLKTTVLLKANLGSEQYQLTEVVNGELVRPLRLRRSDRIQYRALCVVQVGQAQHPLGTHVSPSGFRHRCGPPAASPYCRLTLGKGLHYGVSGLSGVNWHATFGEGPHGGGSPRASNRCQHGPLGQAQISHRAIQSVLGSR